jgi:hypothetical protein
MVRARPSTRAPPRWRTLRGTRAGASVEAAGAACQIPTVLRSTPTRSAMAWFVRPSVQKDGPTSLLQRPRILATANAALKRCPPSADRAAGVAQRSQLKSNHRGLHWTGRVGSPRRAAMPSEPKFVPSDTEGALGPAGSRHL